MAFIIKETREFYGPKYQTRTVCDYFGEHVMFATNANVTARIAELDNAPYTASHNESTRPSYRAVGI